MLLSLSLSNGLEGRSPDLQITIEQEPAPENVVSKALDILTRRPPVWNTSVRANRTRLAGWVDAWLPGQLRRSVEYEDVYLRAYETRAELRAGLNRYFAFYNTRRRHSALDRRTPDAVDFNQAIPDLAA